MKIFQSTTHYNYDWEHVSTANWQKYSPWNEKTPHVIAVDTLSRHVDPASGVLRTERLITCEQNCPKWLTAILGGDSKSQVYECSYVDPKSKTLTLCSHNMTYADLLSVRETVVYTPSAHNPESNTQFTQTAKITAFCGGWQKIKNKIEQFTVDRFVENAAKGREGFEMVLERAREVFAQERERMEMSQRA
ncbi:MSF1-domain-containing protein [Tothia fuscella]|uniref:MSF1-domain-containing protein n=1 Tax=Tothia fuscella TaxID=1048955 RepID=A0A9P4NS94_9PEZI|nr:MSF1-domain-containing protein [Tothia fuscella]